MSKEYSRGLVVGVFMVGATYFANSLVAQEVNFWHIQAICFLIACLMLLVDIFIENRKDKQ